MGGAVGSTHDVRQMQNYVQRQRIPSKDLLHEGLFASHFFDINPDLDPVTDLITTKLFSSKLRNPISDQDEQILVLGLTGREDGQNRRPKTDVVLVIDRSGSMRYSVTDIVIPAAHRTSPSSDGNSVKMRRQKMSLAIEAAKRIFNLLDEDEEVGVLMFDEIVDILEPLKKKSAIDHDSLFAQLDVIEARGGTDFGLGLAAAITMFKQFGRPNRNQRIIFLTDAGPTVGASADAIRDLTETAFTTSNGHLGVTYCGIGLSLDAATCAELCRAHNVSITSISDSAELEETLTTDFNYLVTPIAFDVRVGLTSDDYSVSAVFGGDSDCMRGDSLLEFRTFVASAVGAEGVKGSVLIIHLNPRPTMSQGRAAVRISIDFTPFGTQQVEHQENEYLLSDQAGPLTLKAFALSVYYRTLKEILPETNVRKDLFTLEETTMLVKLRDFMKALPSETAVRLEKEIGLVDQLIMNHTSDQTHLPTSPVTSVVDTSFVAAAEDGDRGSTI